MSQNQSTSPSLPITTPHGRFWIQTYLMGGLDKGMNTFVLSATMGDQVSELKEPLMDWEYDYSQGHQREDGWSALYHSVSPDRVITDNQLRDFVGFASLMERIGSHTITHLSMERTPDGGPVSYTSTKRKQANVFGKDMGWFKIPQEELPFAIAIFENPSNAHLWLVYADFLEESSQDRRATWNRLIGEEIERRNRSWNERMALEHNYRR